MNLYRHLTPSTNAIMERPLKEKINWVRKNHFVYHPKAIPCLDQLKWVYDLTVDTPNDFPSDLEGLTIIGESGSGKTSIVEEFIRIHSSEPDSSCERYDVGYCLIKDNITGLKGLYSALLASFAHPYGSIETIKRIRISVDELEEALLHVLKRSRVKMFIIDEFQHSKGRNQQAILNQLKRTMLVSQVPFIPVGTLAVRYILDLDSQLADRCPVKESTTLNYLSNSAEYRGFLNSYEEFLPFATPSQLGSKDLADRIFERIMFTTGIYKGKTNLRRLVRYVKKLAVIVLQRNADHITEEIIDATFP